jgi:DNA-binding response OmpR family regulator
MTGRDWHILVVDDEPLAAGQVSRFLQSDKVRTSTAGSGWAALAQHAADPADMIVTDLRMPDGDGIELIRTIRAQDAEIPIIVVTGQVLREAEAEALDVGATVLLRKPLDLAELAKRVEQHLPSAQ